MKTLQRRDTEVVRAKEFQVEGYIAKGYRFVPKSVYKQLVKKEASTVVKTPKILTEKATRRQKFKNK